MLGALERWENRSVLASVSVPGVGCSGWCQRESLMRMFWVCSDEEVIAVVVVDPRLDAFWSTRTRGRKRVEGRG
jgi:hypothetical protein